MSQPVIEVTGAPGVVEVNVPAPVANSVLEVETAGPPGPTGPAGPAGPPGPSGAAYVHAQAVAATVWTITHNLGYDPGGILVVDADDYIRDGFGVQVLVPGVTLRLSFDISLAGVAYLS